MRERERREGVLCHTSDQTETTDRRTALMQRSHTVITGDYNYSTVQYSTYIHTTGGKYSTVGGMTYLVVLMRCRLPSGPFGWSECVIQGIL